MVGRSSSSGSAFYIYRIHFYIIRAGGETSVWDLRHDAAETNDDNHSPHPKRPTNTKPQSCLTLKEILPL